MRLQRLTLAVLLCSCTAAQEEDPVLSASRAMLYDVCMAYDDLLARGDVIQEPERRAMHQRAEAACEYAASGGSLE